MKRFTTTVFGMFLFLFTSLNTALAQQETELKHHMTPEEAKKAWMIGRDFYPTDPPDGPVHNIAEFNQMEGVLIRYPFGIPYDLIEEMAEDIMVTTIVANQSQENTVRSIYANNGINLNNCNFIHAPTDSYWTRDYGPWYVLDGNFNMGIVNFPYNRPRPNDNDIPIETAEFLNIDLYGMDLIHAGGNYMTDGIGVSASSDLVQEENPNYTEEEIEQLVEDYLGINTYHMIPDPNGTYIDHIDCWGKYLDVDKVLLREVPQSHSQYDEIEAVVDYFEAQTTSYGTPYEIIRVYTPGDEPYTNSLILNNKVLVPVEGSQWDDEALTAYEEAMPGYEVHGFTGSWQSTDALHCRAKGIADREMIFIDHMPVLGDAPIQNEYIIEAEIVSLSDEPLYQDSLKVYYQINNSDYEFVLMTNQVGDTWTATIPGAPEGSGIAYYIHTADESGKSANHPYIGAPDPHRFYVGGPLYPDIAVDPQEIGTACDEGASVTDLLTISNSGDLVLNYEITTNTQVTETFPYAVPDSPSANSWDYNTYTEDGWTDVEVAEVGTVSALEIEFTWDTDNWPQEGSFLIESPLGTEATIGGGLTEGTYTINLDDFENEEMNGIWKLWIEDTYGDGGHRATDITMNVIVSAEIDEWLSVEPASGSIDPGYNTEIEVISDAENLSEGTYEGHVIIASNDPDQPEVDVPVYLTVEDQYYTISTSVNPPGAGTTSGDGNFLPGEECCVLAESAGAWLFENWTEDGEVVSENAEYCFTVNDDRTLVANFIEAPAHFNFEGGNPADPVYTMYITTATIEEMDMQADDELAVFDGETMVGAFMLTQVCTPDNQFENDLIAFSTVVSGNGYDPGNNIILKAWDASNQTEYTSFNIDFLNPYGDAWTEPYFPEGDGQYSLLDVSFGAVNQQQMNLTSGYQFISSYLMPPEPDLMSLLEEPMNDETLDFVRNSNGSMLQKIGPNWVNNIGDWNTLEGYLFKMWEDDDFMMEGDMMNPQTPISLASGYQFISYLPVNQMDALEAFNEILDNLDFVRNSNGSMLQKIGPNWVNNIGDLNPGEGYLVKMNNDDELVYPLASLRSSITKFDNQYFGFEGGNPADPVYTVFVTKSPEMEIGDEIAAYDGDKLVGAGVIESSNALYNDISLFATLTSVNGFTPGNSLHLKHYDASVHEVKDLNVTWTNPFGDAQLGGVFPSADGAYGIAKVKGATGINELASTILNVYPNPTRENVTLQSENMIDEIRVMNMKGQTLLQFHAFEGSKTINTSAFSSGVYLIEMRNDNTIQHQKLIKR